MMAASRKNYDAIGKRIERDFVAYSRANGFENADRTIKKGDGKDYGVRADRGDIDLCPGVIAQSKRLATNSVNDMEREVPAWMAATEAQRVAACADVALLVVARKGIPDVSRWWCFLPMHGLTALTFDVGPIPPEGPLDRIPVRLSVGDAFTLLRDAGYGSPLGVAA